MSRVNQFDENNLLIDANFWDLINEKNYTFLIPRIQRDYVQGNKENICKKILNDIRNSLINNKKIDLGFIYGTINNDNFEPIDGQQRLTTLFLLYVYILSKLGMEKEVQKIIEHFSYDTRITTKRFFSKLNELKEYFMVDNKLDIVSFIKNRNWYSNSFDTDPSTQAALKTLKYIDEIFSKIDEVNLSKIIEKKNCPITFQFFDIINLGNSKDLYIKMNSRGKILSRYESFKANLYDYCNKIIDDDFKINFEDKCYEIIFNQCIEKDVDPILNADIEYMKLIHYVLLAICLLKVNSKNDFTEMYNIYKENLTNNYFDIYKTTFTNDTIRSFKNFIDFYLEINDNKDNILQKMFDNFTIENVARLSAIIRYIDYIYDENQKFNYDLFKKYFRIINNLINNSNIDNEDNLYYVINGIKNIQNNLLNNIECEIANIEIMTIIKDL